MYWRGPQQGEINRGARARAAHAYSAERSCRSNHQLSLAVLKRADPSKATSSSKQEHTTNGFKKEVIIKTATRDGHKNSGGYPIFQEKGRKGTDRGSQLHLCSFSWRDTAGKSYGERQIKATRLASLGELVSSSVVLERPLAKGREARSRGGVAASVHG